MSTGQITREDQGAVRTLVFDRPARKNALTRAMYEQLNAELTRAAEDDAVRVVVLTGAGDAFTAGNDLHDFMQDPPSGPDSPVFGFLTHLLEFPKPLMAAVNGVAVGVGVTLLLHCDLAFVDEAATLKLPFVPLGLVPEAGSSLLIPGLVGHRRASELLLYGGKFGAADAVSFGLANRTAPAGEVRAVTAERAAALAALPPAAVRESKALLRAPIRDALRETMQRESEVFARRLRSPETAEAITAFFEKRAPDFSRFT